jgi:hypothetical protein
MKKSSFFLYTIIFLILSGCATPGQKFIDISYLAEHEASMSGTIGISTFKDLRKDAGDGYIGYRILMDNSQETYFVNGMNLGQTLSDTVLSYTTKKGFATSKIDEWEASPDGVAAAIKGFNQIIGGSINTFECRAIKKGAITDMILVIDLTLYTGIPDKNTLKTIPVTFSLERTEFTFTKEKLQQFVNESIEDVIQKALVL